jgi:hypothetical protein
MDIKGLAMILMLIVLIGYNLFIASKIFQDWKKERAMAKGE